MRFLLTFLLEKYILVDLFNVIFTFMSDHQGRVRLYRRVDHRLSYKSKVLTTWHRYKSDVRLKGDDKIAYVDIPEYLLFACDGDKYGRYYTLKGAARRFARRSWKIMKLPSPTSA